MTRLEVVVASVEDALAALEGGADSLEIAMDYEADGLTPPLWMVREILDAMDNDTEAHVILRPHSEGFLYTPHEIDSILHDADMFAGYSVDGLVFGAHTADGAFDFDLTRRVMSAAAGKTLTIHRAIDTCKDPHGTLKTLIDMGITRILTSGVAPNAQQGRDTLRQWVKQYGHAAHFVASGAIMLETAADLATFSGVPTIHVGRAVRTNGVVDAMKVRALVERLER